MRIIDSQQQKILEVADLDVFYGKAHALQQVSLSLPQGVLAVVGRNGMGKTTLCKAITGMVAASGSVRFNGKEILGLAPNAITHVGIAYVPQGRRVWRSLTVDETLRLSATTARKGAWTVDRVYDAFPRLAERRGNGGAQLSGGEQQMLAIGRALLFNPKLLVMDEPTEGLAPVIVEHVATMLRELAEEGSISVLLIEQNLGVALEVADRVAIMVNGRIAHELPAAELAADKALQQRLLGLKAGAVDVASESSAGATDGADSSSGPSSKSILRVVRTFASKADRHEAYAHPRGEPGASGQLPVQEAGADGHRPPGRPRDLAVYVAGSFTAKNVALACAVRSLEKLQMRVVTVDIGGEPGATSQIDHHELMGYGTHAGDALASFMRSRTDIGALLVVAGTQHQKAVITAMQVLPAGLSMTLISDSSPTGLNPEVAVITVPLHIMSPFTEQLLAGAASGIALTHSRAVHTEKAFEATTTISQQNPDIQRTRRTQS